MMRLVYLTISLYILVSSLDLNARATLQGAGLKNDF